MNIYLSLWYSLEVTRKGLAFAITAEEIPSLLGLMDVDI